MRPAQKTPSDLIEIGFLPQIAPHNDIPAPHGLGLEFREAYQKSVKLAKWHFHG